MSRNETAALYRYTTANVERSQAGHFTVWSYLYGTCRDKLVRGGT